MERSTVIDMMADAMWTLAAMEAESEGLRAANVGSRCHQMGIVEGYARILSLMFGGDEDNARFFHVMIQARVRETVRDMTATQSVSHEDARKRVHDAMSTGVIKFL